MADIEQEAINALYQIKMILRLLNINMSQRISLACSKCASIDIEMEFLRAGTKYLLSNEPPLEKDILACHCITCGYRWDEIPFDQREPESP